MDPRWNTSSGRKPDGTFKKSEGAELVAKVMSKAEAHGSKSGGRSTWNIESGNHAKTIR